MGINNYLALSLSVYANQAALPVVGADGRLAMVLDDGTGKPAIFVWDSGASSWILCTGGSVGSLVWQDPVIDKDISDPTPLTPSAGDRYIIWPPGAGAWTGEDDNIAEWDGSSWDIITVYEGFAVYVEDEDFIYVYTGASWVRMSTRIDHGLLLGLGDDDHTQYHNDARGDARYYTKTESDANPVAAGAKIDKFVGTDNTLVRSDGITGDVQDSPHILDDTGALENTGTSSQIKTSDKTGASNSVTISQETGDVTGGGATGVSGDIDQETGATVDGKSGDIKRTTGTPTGTGARGDILDEARNISFAPDIDLGITLAVDKLFKLIDDGANEFFKGWYTSTGVTIVATTLAGNATYPIAIHFVGANANTSDAGVMFFSTPAKLASFSAAGFAGHWSSNPDGLTVYSSDGTLALITLQDSSSTSGISEDIAIKTGPASTTNPSGNIDIETGAQTNAGDYDSGSLAVKTGLTGTAGDSGAISATTGNAADDSGDIELTTGTAGGTRGSILLDGANATLDAFGDFDTIGAVTSTNIGATETQPGTSELATQAETDAGTDDARIVTPLKLATRKGPQLAKRTAIADANHNALATDYLITYTSITAARVVNLPDPATVPNLILVIKDESGAVTAVNKITLTPAAGNIDGAASLDIVNAYGAKEVYSNGSNWFTK